MNQRSAVSGQHYTHLYISYHLKLLSEQSRSLAFHRSVEVFQKELAIFLHLTIISSKKNPCNKLKLKLSCLTVLPKTNFEMLL